MSPIFYDDPGMEEEQLLPGGLQAFRRAADLEVVSAESGVAPIFDGDPGVEGQVPAVGLQAFTGRRAP